jgi:hypothetical protein
MLDRDRVAALASDLLRGRSVVFGGEGIRRPPKTMWASGHTLVITDGMTRSEIDFPQTVEALQAILEQG